MQAQASNENETSLFESALVGAFLYMCGYEDARAGRKRDESAYLGNQQSKFDHLFGDVFGKVDGRFFLIEFKRTRNLFKYEVVGAKAKPMRVKLYDAYWNSPYYLNPRKEDATWALGRFGHFGAYEVANGKDVELRFEAYGRALHDETYFSASKESKLKIALTPHAKKFLQTYIKAPFSFSGSLDFQHFYKATNATEGGRANSQGSKAAGESVLDKTLYPYHPTGLGLPADSFYEYLERMLSCMDKEEIEKASGSGESSTTLVGWFSSEFKKLVFIQTTVDELLVHFHKYKLLVNKKDTDNKNENEKELYANKSSPYKPR